MADNEFVAGTPVKITMTFTDLLTEELQDPSAATLGIQNGRAAPLTVTLSAFTQISTGVWYYVFDTTNAPGEYTTQVQSTGSLVAISDADTFTILPPSITGLT